MDGAVGFGMFDFFAEVTRSFDSMPDGDGGGFGGLLRSVTTFQKQNELEASLRYYDEDFKNPYARPIAAPDEFEASARATRWARACATPRAWTSASACAPPPTSGRRPRATAPTACIDARADST